MSLNKHLKILMVVAHYPFPIVGGLEKQAHELSKFLVLKQVTVSVLSGKFANSQDSLEWINTQYSRLNTQWHGHEMIDYGEKILLLNFI